MQGQEATDSALHQNGVMASRGHHDHVKAILEVTL